MKRLSRGLTLIELVVTVAVLGVLGAAAFPAMGEFIDRQRLVSQTLAIAELAQTARSEAIKRTGSGGHDEKLITMAIATGSPWSVGLTGKPNTVTSTQCSGCTMVEPVEPGNVIFDFRGVVRSSTQAQTKITLQSPKGRKLSVYVSRLGRITVCTPEAMVTGYPTCPV